MKTASWVILVVVGALTLLGSLASAYVAYGTPRDQLVPGTSLRDVEGWRSDVALAVRARRATASAYAAAFATLFLCVAAGPYRRGEVWSWWALLGATAVLAGLTLLRIPLLGTRLGAGAVALQLGLVVLALLLDAGRLKVRTP